VRHCKICDKPLSMVSGELCLSHIRFASRRNLVASGVATDFIDGFAVNYAEMQTKPLWHSARSWKAEILTLLAGKGVVYDG